MHQQIKKIYNQVEQKYNLKIPDLSKDLLHLDDVQTMQIYCSFFNNYIFSSEILLHDHHVMRFLEISEIKHTNRQKYKECFMEKQAGGRFNQSRLARCGVCWGLWNKRYFCITSEGVSYSQSPNENLIREQLIYDKDFQVLFGMQDTGYKTGIILITSSRRLLIKALDLFQFYDFLISLKLALEQSPYLTTHRYASFAPIRENCSCKFYVDGQDYYHDVYDAISLAKKEIFITDWWLSPHFYLKRPVGQDKNQHTRLDRLLQKVSQINNVKIFIIVWCEPKVALTIDSLFTKNTLESLNPINIKVLRHPNYTIPFMWSHHEKMVIIDQTIGFMGGLDLCYGRMDNEQHKLFDNQDVQNQFWPGIDYSNSRICDFANVQKFEQSDIRRNLDPRMPWHDVAVQITGLPVIDLSRHFIQYWNFATVDLEFNNRLLLTPNINENIKQIKLVNNKNQIQSTTTLQYNQEKYQNYQDDQISAQPNNSFYHQKDAQEEYLQQLMQNAKQSMSNEEHKSQFKPNQNESQNIYLNFQPVQELENKSEDLQLMQKQLQKGIFKLLLTSNFIKNSQVEQQKKENPNRYFSLYLGKQSDLQLQKSSTITPYYILYSYNNYKQGSKSISKQNEINEIVLDSQFIEMLNTIKKSQNEEVSNGFYQHESSKSYNSSPMLSPIFLQKQASKEIEQIINQMTETNENNLILNNQNKKITIEGNCNCQILRSSSIWSTGIKDTESSIHMAYVQLIGQAQHFIYIENQFFISGLAGDPVTNQISNALVSRIQKAHQNQEKFRVIVLLPLVPGFAGEIQNQPLLKIQMHWQYATICRGGTSIYETLRKYNIPNPEQYISFFSLRKHDKINNIPMTEILYIHSKLMIVDDRNVIIGSANINDRSLKGPRDSEIALQVEDKEECQIKFNYITTNCGVKAHNLRKNLFMEHFGLTDQEVQDPLSDEFFEAIQNQAKINTQFYREVFRAVPDDDVKVSEDIPKFELQKNLFLYEKFKDQVKGNVVQFPLQFLENENLKLKFYQKEFYVPEINFT